VSLAADVRLRVGDLDLCVGLRATPGELIVMVGPNGAGKTTLLRVLAGLQPLDSGSVHLDGEVLDDPAAGVFVPPERRAIGVVFQDALLFPHLGALENVAFGLRSRGAPRNVARADAAQWLDRVDLSGRGGARPNDLSGGEAQRVALARALAPEPRLLLLDEPLAALDVSTRAGFRHELRRNLASYEGIRILVTHDPLEALALADRIVVLENGRVVQEGTPGEVRARPRSRYAADLVGVNLLRGTSRGHDVVLQSGTRVTTADELGRGEVLVVVHPRSIALHRRAPEGSPRNVWETTVSGLDFEGERVRVRLEGPVSLVAEVTPASVAELALTEAAPVWAAVKATELRVFPA
jgi:molybdate transport system ATP-binding protein